jgi:hypothetical protein
MTTAVILEFQPRPSPATESEPVNQHLLHVTFESTDGERRSAFGGGQTVAEAVAAARDELPLGADWTVARWAPLYGE